MAKPSVDLSVYTQAQIDAIMAKKTNERTVEETRVYKKVKLVEWLARGKTRADGKKTPIRISTPTVAKPTVDDMISRNAKPLEDEVEKPEVEETTEEYQEFSRKKTGYTVPKKWMNVPFEEKMDKEDLISRKILVNCGEKSELCAVEVGTDGNPVASCSRGKYQLTWAQVYIAVNYAAIIRAPQIEDKALDEEEVK